MDPANPPQPRLFYPSFPILDNRIASLSINDPQARAADTKPAGPLPHRRHRVSRSHDAQRSIDRFWSRFTSSNPSKPWLILPNNTYPNRLSTYHRLDSPEPGRNALHSYDAAREQCVAKVDKIVKECRRLNQKYRDPHFDIEADFRQWRAACDAAAEAGAYVETAVPFSDCLMGLIEDGEGSKLHPASVKRVEDIFEDPRFFIEGATASDIRQGREGDCWFMSALTTLSNKEGLIQRVCVARDEEVGVYGFVFHRDGEWISEVIDDKLYLIKEDFNDVATAERKKWMDIGHRNNPEEEWRIGMQTGSRALYFAQCRDENETWLPLLEKAYAKAHGDYASLETGFVGEGIEDLTGGVTTELFSTDVLDKEKFWKEELLKVNQEFLFGCGQMGGKYGSRNGIVEKHAYSIMEAREVNGQRLLKLRNPWGNTEWKGAWSDGSSEWTPEWMTLLNHKFGDDGVFWISYRDLLRNYQHFDRTRLFGPEWTITQQWTSVHVPWSVSYLDTKFTLTLTKASPVVLVLSQLDERYFRGLEGQYEFNMQFRLHKDGEEEYIVRSNKAYYMKRSISTELDLEAGHYSVLLKITARRDSEYPTVEEVVMSTCRMRREKLLSIGLSYDLAHAKGHFPELEREKRDREIEEWKEHRKTIARRRFEWEAREHKKQKLREIRLAEKNAAREAKRAEQQREAEEADASKKANLEEVQPSTNGLDIVDGRYGSSLPSTHGQPTPPLKQGQNPSPLRAMSPADVPVTPPSSARRDTFPSKPNTPQIDTGVNLTHRNPPNIQAPPRVRILRSATESSMQSIKKKVELSDISDDELSWDSDIDAPDTEIDEEIRAAARGLPHLTVPDGGFGGRGGYNSRGGYNGRGGYNSRGYNDAIPGFEGRGGYNEDSTGFQGRGGYNEDSFAYTGRGGYNEDPYGFMGRGGYNEDPYGFTGRGGYNEDPYAYPGRADFYYDPRLHYHLDAPHLHYHPDAAYPHYHPDTAYHHAHQHDLDPWNAVCVVGLRVYSKDTSVSISVDRSISQNREAMEKDPDTAVPWHDYQRWLDVDDSNKDASKEPVSPSMQEPVVERFGSLNDVLRGGIGGPVGRRGVF